MYLFIHAVRQSKEVAKASLTEVKEMMKKELNKNQMAKYLVWTFLPAYIIQVCVWLLYTKGYAAVGQLVMAAMMFVPTLGVLLSGHSLKGMGWNPHIDRNVILLLTAWFLPAVLTAVGAALYFLIFPGQLDLSGSAMAAAVGEEVFAQLAAQGITYPMYVLINVFSAVSYAPLINGLLALGEEIGWRGFLYSQLKAKCGRKKGWLVGGIIWGAWHWPLIWLIGYEYGFGYVGFPVTGMLLFCVFTVAMGILCDWLYERSGSIWFPAVCHGAVNAAATIPLAVFLAGNGSASARLLGPVPNGIIAGLPLLAVGVILLLRSEQH